MSYETKKTYLRKINYTFPAGQRAEIFPVEVNFVSVFSVKTGDAAGEFKDVPGDTPLFRIDLSENSFLEQVPGFKCNIRRDEVTGKLTLSRIGDDLTQPLRVNLFVGWDSRPDEVKPPFEDHRAIFDIAKLSLDTGTAVAAAIAPILTPLADAVAGVKAAVDKLNAPLRTRIIMPFSGGAEKTGGSDHTEIKPGEVLQVAGDDKNAVRRRVHLALNTVTAANQSAAPKGQFFVQLGGNTGAFLRRIVLNQYTPGASPFDTAHFDGVQYTGYVEIEGGDALSLRSMAGNPVARVVVEEIYRGETKHPNTRDYVRTIENATLPPPPAITGTDLTPVLAKMDDIIAGLAAGTGGNPSGGGGGGGDPKVCQWPSVPVYVDEYGKWWEIQGAYTGAGDYTVTDDAYNSKTIFVPPDNVQCKAMTRVPTSVGDTTVISTTVVSTTIMGG